MNYFAKPAPKKSRTAKRWLTVITILLICILGVCIHGMFFYDEAYENSRELVEENTNLKIQLRESELKLEEAERKISELSTALAAAEASSAAPSEEEQNLVED